MKITLNALMTKFRGFPTKEELREMKRREILRCASEKFGKDGFENVSLNTIAAELGVTKTALYYYVSGKTDLLMQCYQVGMEEILDAIRAEAKGDGTAAERLENALVAYIGIMTRSDMQYLWNYVRPEVAEENGKIVQQQRDDVDQLVRELLQEGIADGSMRADMDVKLASLVILGAVNWVGIWYRKGGSWKPKDVAAMISKEALKAYLA